MQGNDLILERIQRTIDRFGPGAPLALVYLDDRPMSARDIQRGQEIARELGLV